MSGLMGVVPKALSGDDKSGGLGLAGVAARQLGKKKAAPAAGAGAPAAPSTLMGEAMASRQGAA